MAVPVDSGGGGGYGVSSWGALPTIGAWALLAVLFVAVGSRWPEWSYGTLLLVLLYLGVTHGREIGDLGARFTAGLAGAFS